MSRKKANLMGAAMALVVAVGLTACSKTDQADFSSSESETWSLDASQSIDQTADDATFGRSEGGGQGVGVPGLDGPCDPLDNLPSCASVSESGDSYPKTIIIDFGEGCEDDAATSKAPEGRPARVKAGKIVITLTAPMEEFGAVRTVTFDNFTVNDHPVEGSRVTTNIGSESGYMTFVKQVDMTVETPRGTMTRSFSGEKQWIAGFDTETCDDNVFLLSGSGSGSCGNGGERTMNILEPLLIDRSCGYITQGVIEHTRDGNSASIDFGDGDCDNVAELTKDGETTEINLDEHRAHKRGPRPQS